MHPQAGSGGFDAESFMKAHEERMARMKERREEMMERHKRMMASMPSHKPSKSIEEGLAALKERLKITDAQKAAWEAYAKAVTEQTNSQKAQFEKNRKMGMNPARMTPNYNMADFQKQRDEQIKAMEQQVKQQRAEYEASIALMSPTFEPQGKE